MREREIERASEGERKTDHKKDKQVGERVCEIKTFKEVEIKREIER